MRTQLVLCAILVLWSVPPLRAEEPPPSLERAWAAAAPKIIEHCKKQDYNNVGVLKFLARHEGQEKFSDNIGTLNRNLARQLETALILYNRPSSPVGIADDPSSIAAKIPGTSYFKKEGREKLFDREYPLAWGTEKVKLDAFITGWVTLHKDARTLDVTFKVFDKAGNFETLAIGGGNSFEASITAAQLTETGVGFLNRGLFDSGKIEVKVPQAESQREQAEKEAFSNTLRPVAPPTDAPKVVNPLADKNAPFRMELLYDGVVVPFEYREGKAFAPEPKTGQKVLIRVVRHEKLKEGKFGLLVKVNGLNTIFKQQAPDAKCRVWLNDPGDRPKEIKGFQVDKDNLEEFRVLSVEESQAKEINYGSDVGTITLTVFAERKSPMVKPPLEEVVEQKHLETILTQPKLEKKPDTHGALLRQMEEEIERGLLDGGGKVEKSTVNIVKFERDPTPVMGVTVVYYKKK